MIEIKEFEIKCKKCESCDIEIETESSKDYGGLTGCEPGSFIIKCRKCGNAFTEYV